MSAVQLTGLVSGIDTRSIVDQIIAARTQPIFQFEDRITEQEARRTALDDLRGRISTLMTRTKNLASISRLNSRTGLISKSATNDTRVASIAVDSTAAIGSFTLSVEQLATATQVESTGAIGQSIDAAVTLDLAGFGTTPVVGTFTIAGNASATITIDASDTLTTVIAKINAETGTTGITATQIGNTLEMDSGGGPTIVLGAGGDTSNFLKITHLLASPGTTTRTSTRGMGQTLADGNLVDARLTTALSASTGSFTVNGVTITYDETNQSLNDVLGDINSSEAGVTAVYDSLTDTIKITSNSVGSSGITLTDVSGNFLAATGMLAATQTVGLNAAYKIDGGATQYSSSNIVSDALPGVTLTLLAAEAGDNATVTIGSNDDKVVTDIQDFVEQYNSVTDFIRELTLANPDGDSGVLSRDSGIRLLGQSLRSTVVGLGQNLTTQFTSLSDVGITFGTVGSELGETNLLKVNEADLREAIKDYRKAVVQLFAAVEVSAAFGD